MSHSIEWRCPECERPSLQELDEPGALSCDNCSHQQDYDEAACTEAGGVTDPLEACVVCGYDRLFAQKDFNRKLGLVIVLIGAALSPWTYGLSLLAFMGFDYALYRFVPEITVCYGCDAIHRGFEHNPLHRAHDPLLADRYKREAPDSPLDD
jgi:hypothetical protein